ncbi:hypothetical protein C2E23DRAFT_764330 [Lenzites betulinus]|nr:hypothetical protein C2E23DRAFT_764330 [Lenzites betulinus]
MFSSFLNMFSSKSAPSVVLLVRTLDGRTDAILHVIPEDGTIEVFASTGESSRAATRLRHYGAVEQSREELGTVTLNEFESVFWLDGDVRARAKKLMENLTLFGDAREEETGSVPLPRLAEEILKPAALDAIHAMEVREIPTGDVQVETHHVYLVYVNRPHGPGEITGEPRTLPHCC